MIQVGNAVTLDGMGLIVGVGEGGDWPGGQYRPVHDIATALEDARERLLRDCAPGLASKYEPPLPYAIELLGSIVALQFELAAPIGALAHRNIPLYAHRDTQNPGPCTNATVFFRHATEGGWLVLCEDRIAVDATDGWVAIFDGQNLHGNTPTMYPNGAGYRLALTYYLPR